MLIQTSDANISLVVIIIFNNFPYSIYTTPSKPTLIGIIKTGDMQAENS